MRLPGEFWAVLEVLLPLLIALAYASRIRTLAAEGRSVSILRQLSFAAGLLLVLIATATPLESLAAELVTAHMTQHLLLADFASLLLALGLTGPLLQPVLARLPPRAAAALGNPMVALALFTFNLYLWHLPVLYQAARGDTPAHFAEHALFLGTGVLMWLALVGPLPKPAWFGNLARVGYAAGIWLPASALANILMWTGSPAYPAYEQSALARGIDPLADQSTAGAVLMVECSLLAIAVFTWAVLRWATHDTEVQDLVDFALEKGIELDRRRAERAVNAGEGARLRRRIVQQASPG